MLTERPSSRKAPVAEAENIPPPPRRGGRPSKPVDAAGLPQTSSAPSPTTWIPEDATPCGEGHRSVESQYQDALRALERWATNPKRTEEDFLPTLDRLRG